MNALKILLIVVIVLFVAVVGIAAIRFGLGGSEDNWVCTNGQWVKHGQPKSPMPSSGCGSPLVSVSPAVATTTPQLIGGQRDEHGCLVAAGYSWCDVLQKCIRPWEEKCVAASLAPSNFQETGNLVWVPAFAGKDTKVPRLVYEKPGSPALTANIAFGVDSVCTIGGKIVECNEANVVSGSRVKIVGRSENLSVAVRTLSSVAKD